MKTTIAKVQEYILATFPVVEVLFRILYWKTSAGFWLFSKLKVKESAKSIDSGNNDSNMISRLQNEIVVHGINSGDILIVHSSKQILSSNGMSVSEVLSLLLNQLGPSGTLVMPAFPLYRQNRGGSGYHGSYEVSETWTYDVKRTPPWTGALPYALMKMKGAVRSRFPLNSIVAIGKHAEAMVKHELDVDGATPCGPNSAWAYCANRNAKILMLGVDLAHNLTMIHVAEDCFEKVWPIANWYRNRSFNIVFQGSEQIVNVRERRPKWSLCYAERMLNQRLIKERIAKISKIGSMSVISLESSKLIEHLQKVGDDGYPYCMWQIFR